MLAPVATVHDRYTNATMPITIITSPIESTLAIGTWAGTAKMSLSQRRCVSALASTLLSEMPSLLNADSDLPAACQASPETGIRPPLLKITATFESSPKPTSQNAGTRTFSSRKQISSR